MRRAALFTFLASLSLLTLASGAAWQLTTPTSQKMTACANDWLGQLKPDQLAKAQLEYDAPNRADWHFIPKDSRKGLQVREMTPEQRKSADKLLAACLSAAGYKKVSTIMDLEVFLKTVQTKKKETTPLRDSERYYFTIFGKPDTKAKWGLSIEGHHLSLNFVVEGEKLVSTSPLALCSNPAEVMTTYSEASKTPKGTRVLAAEESIAFDLLSSLSDEQKKKAIIADKAPAELREAAQAQPKQESPVGIVDGDLNDKQKSLLAQLIAVYFNNLPEDIAMPQLGEVVAGGVNSVHFAWAGATKPDIGHYYRIQGKTFLIEFVNVQPDAEGNPANHVHCVLRNLQGDFGIALEKK